MVAEVGELDAGLFFIAFQRDPQRQFVAVQRRLGTSDALNEYIKHTSSAIFAIPPGRPPRRLRGRDPARLSAPARGFDLRGR